ncbi:MAG: tetratricopeptide repeat protein, partial [Gammaproteobacteria bacterium]|nr:tetratricopeptide repeat protein [Gammaproteobacteria bacterium]
AIELRPREIDAHYNLGTMYQRIGYYSGAANHFEAVVNMQPNHPYATKALADVRTSFAETGNRVESDVIPRTPFEDGGAAVSRNAMTQARAYYEEAIRSDPHHAAAYCGLGTTYFGPGDYETAVSIFERGLAYKSDHFVLNNNIAGAHYRLGNKDKAIHYWGVCLEIDPGNKDVMRQIGVARSRK